MTTLKLPKKIPPISGYGEDADRDILSYVVRGVAWCVENDVVLKRTLIEDGGYPSTYRENLDFRRLREFLGSSPPVSGSMLELAISLIEETLNRGEERFINGVTGKKVRANAVSRNVSKLFLVTALSYLWVKTLLYPIFTFPDTALARLVSRCLISDLSWLNMISALNVSEDGSVELKEARSDIFFDLGLWFPETIKDDLNLDEGD